MVRWLHSRKGRGKPKFRIYVTHPGEPENSGSLPEPKPWFTGRKRVDVYLGMWVDFDIARAMEIEKREFGNKSNGSGNPDLAQ